MVNYINEYIDKNAYDGDSTKDFPNVSLIDSTDSIEWALEDTNNKVTVSELFEASTTQHTINSYTNVSAMSVDGVPQQNIVAELTFDTEGYHSFEFTLIDPTVIEANMFLRIHLKDLTLPNAVTSIGNGAFSRSFSTTGTDITIGSNVTSIGSEAFYSCQHLESVTILATTPPTLGTRAFSNHTSSIKFYVPAESVDAYKADSTWKSESLDRFVYAIPE